MLIIRILLLSLLCVLPVQFVWAADTVATMLSELIYLLELLVLAVVSIGLILVTLSIAKSRQKLGKFVTDCREEMNQERAVLKLTMESVQEKEQQISYMAHLLQKHLEIDLSDVSEVVTDKKKASEPEILVEVLDDPDVESEYSAQNTFHSSAKHETKIDPRMVAADGSVKRAHFGPDQFLLQMSDYQQQVSQHIQNSVKQANQYLGDVLTDIQAETETVEKERSRIKECIFAIQANIRFKDTQRMNTKDSQLIKQLERVDARLEQLKSSQIEISKQYQQAIREVKKFTAGFDDELVSEPDEAVSVA